MELAAAHALDLLGDIVPIQFIDASFAQQLGLLLRPQKDVGVVGIVAHGSSGFPNPTSPSGSSLCAMSWHMSVHSLQMKTIGPAISLATSFWLLPQKLQ